jgi:hypothetical protein
VGEGLIALTTISPTPAQPNPRPADGAGRRVFNFTGLWPAGGSGKSHRFPAVDTSGRADGDADHAAQHTAEYPDSHRPETRAAGTERALRASAIIPAADNGPSDRSTAAPAAKPTTAPLSHGRR